MENTNPGLALTVTTIDRQSMDAELDAAVAAVREQSIIDRQQGILVTRYAPGSFTVELSDEVPFGLTLERDSIGSAG